MAYSNAALADQLQYIRRRQDRQNEKMMMIQDSYNKSVELLNVISEFLDGQSTTRKDKGNPLKNIVDVFVGKKLEYLELTDGELGETR